MYKTWIEIDAEKYGKNLDFFRSRLDPNVILSLVVKSNGYGHGLEEIVTLASKSGIGHFCVHNIEEALRVKNTYNNAKILIMGYITPDELDVVIENEFELVCFNADLPALAEKSAKKMDKIAVLHLKLETGTNRYGLDRETFCALLPEIKKYKHVRLEGLYTHYANIEDTTDHTFAQHQLIRFLDFQRETLENNFSGLISHTACSAAILLFPQTHFQMVRLGISQYGFWPSRETYLSYLHKKNTTDESGLQPILTWKTRISQIKEVDQDQFIGYGCTYRVTRKSKIAVLPVGYADGYDRKLSNKGYVLINGKRAQIRGRICMNLIMVDITDIPDVKVNDEVVLIGRQNTEWISAEDIAAWAESIHYEVITRISQAIPRVVV